MLTALAIIFVLLILYAIASYVGGQKIIARRQPDPSTPPNTLEMTYQDIQFNAQDGLNLQGWWIKGDDNKPVIIICHGQNGSMDGDILQASWLNEAGFNVLMFNFRAHGKSEGDAVTFGIQEKNDVLGAIDYVQQTHPEKAIGILAFSMGTLATLNAAIETTAIDAMVLDGVTDTLENTLRQWLTSKKIPYLLASLFVFGSVRMASMLSVTNLLRVMPQEWAQVIQPTPTFFIHAENDQFVELSTIKVIQSSIPAETDLWVAENCKHREGHKTHPVQYKHKIVDWFDKFLH